MPAAESENPARCWRALTSFICLFLPYAEELPLSSGRRKRLALYRRQSVEMAAKKCGSVSTRNEGKPKATAEKIQ
jgi:hypothetical protein